MEFPKSVVVMAMLPFFVPSPAALAQEKTDTVPVQRLETVEISAPRAGRFRSAAPVQSLAAGHPAVAAATTVADVARRFAGAQVKDYGGAGGLKTVSLRGLGAGYTSVACDGLPQTDHQTGQIDLGRFALTNVESVSLSIGESDDIFLPASLQALAGALNITTRQIMPDSNRRLHLKTALRAGQFGLVNPSITVGRALSDRFAASVSADFLQSEGNFPYSQTTGFDADSTVCRIRQNSDVRNLNAEINLVGRLRNGGLLSMKTTAFTTDRGLPGPAIYYSDYSRDRLNDRNFAVAPTYRQRLSAATEILVNARFSYFHSDYQTARRYLFSQREYFADAVALHRFSRIMSVSWANDLTRADIDGTMFAGQPQRTTWLSALSAKAETDRIDMTAKLLYTCSDNSRLSPYLGLSVRPLPLNTFRIRAFFKNTFRQPTLSDFYYSALGRRNLKPENATQWNLGLTFADSPSPVVPNIFLSADAYVYSVRDKLTAWPTNDMNFWTIVNIGRVHISGIDLKAEATAAASSSCTLRTGASLTMQRVVDRTDPSKATWNRMLPYTPRYSGSAWTGFAFGGFDLSYTVLFSGRRYSEASNRPESQMQPFAEQTVALSKQFNVRYGALTVSAECVNVADVQYEIVRSYPMQGRTFRGVLTYGFQP